MSVENPTAARKDEEEEDEELNEEIQESGEQEETKPRKRRDYFASVLRAFVEKPTIANKDIAIKLGIPEPYVTEILNKASKMYANAVFRADETGGVTFDEIIEAADHLITEKEFIERVLPVVKAKASKLISEQRGTKNVQSASSAEPGGSEQQRVSFGEVKTKGLAFRAMLDIVPGVNERTRQHLINLYEADMGYQEDEVALYNLLAGVLGAQRGHFAWYHYMLMIRRIQNKDAQQMQEWYKTIGGAPQPMMAPDGTLIPPQPGAGGFSQGYGMPAPPQMPPMMGMGQPQQQQGMGMNPAMMNMMMPGAMQSPLVMMILSNPQLLQLPMYQQMLQTELARIAEDEKEKAEERRTERQLRMMGQAATMTMMTKAAQGGGGDGGFGAVPPGYAVKETRDPQSGAVVREVVPIMNQQQQNGGIDMVGMFRLLMDFQRDAMSKKDDPVTAELMKGIINKALNGQDSVQHALEVLGKLKEAGLAGAADTKSLDVINAEMDGKLKLFNANMQMEQWKAQQAAARDEKIMQHENAKEYIGGIKQAAETVVKPIVEAVTRNMAGKSAVAADTQGAAGGASAANVPVPMENGRIAWHKIPDEHLAILRKERDQVYHEINQKQQLLSQRSTELEAELKRREALKAVQNRASEVASSVVEQSVQSPPPQDMSTENPLANNPDYGGTRFAVSG